MGQHNATIFRIWALWERREKYFIYYYVTLKLMAKLVMKVMQRQLKVFFGSKVEILPVTTSICAEVLR